MNAQRPRHKPAEVERLIEAELIAIAGLLPEAERLASDERDAQERGAADRD